MELPIGEVIEIEGRKMRHVGGGRFEPVEVCELLTKRHDSNEGEALHKVPHAIQPGSV